MSSYLTPRVGIGLIVALFAIHVSVLSAYGLQVSDEADWLWNFAFALLLALWVRTDRRGRGYSAPFEHEAFVFFAWPLVIPYYLYRTRGRVGLLQGAGVWALSLLPLVCAGIARNIAK